MAWLRTIALNITVATGLLAMACLLGGCEPASQWDERSGRFRSTDELKAERRNDQRANERRLDRLEGRERP